MTQTWLTHITLLHIFYPWIVLLVHASRRTHDTLLQLGSHPQSSMQIVIGGPWIFSPALGDLFSLSTILKGQVANHRLQSTLGNDKSYMYNSTICISWCNQRMKKTPSSWSLSSFLLSPLLFLFIISSSSSHPKSKDSAPFSGFIITVINWPKSSKFCTKQCHNLSYNHNLYVSAYKYLGLFHDSLFTGKLR